MDKLNTTRQDTYPGDDPCRQPGEWSLAQEILFITHNWPWPVLAFLLCSLIGWGVSFLVHPSYRAETRITVAYSADAFYRNPDDYKNWQMSQLDLLTNAPDVLEETLTRLQVEDPYWQSASLEDLQHILLASWRNTGVWRLVASHEQPQRAAQAALTWTEVILETYQAASQSASEILPYDTQFRAIAYQQARAQSRLERLKEVQTALQAQRRALAQVPEKTLLKEDQCWKLYALAAQAAGDDPAWQSLLETEIPPADSLASAYLPWIDHVLASIAAELETLPGQASALEVQRAALYEQYLQTVERSRGLSSTLVVEWPFRGIWQTEVVRPTGLIILVSGLLGLLAWGAFWLVRLTLRRAPLSPPAHNSQEG